MINFIVNATSGRGRGQKNLKKIINYCYKNKIEYTVHLTSRKGHASMIAKALCDNNSRTIVAVGGDGTFHEVLNGISTLEKTTLGFIPSGRGNDFAKGIGISLKPVKALEMIVKNKTRQIDYISVNEKRCLNIGGTGLDIDVLKRTDGRKSKLSYLKNLLYCIFHFTPYNMSVEIDGQAYQFSCITTAVCNGTQFGGGIKVSPDSKIDDGLLDVIVMSMPKNGKILRIMPKFVKGKHMDMDITTHFRCSEVNIKTEENYPIQLDGEIYENTQLNCKIIKGGLKTFCE